MLTFDFTNGEGSKQSNLKSKIDEQIETLIQQASQELDQPNCEYDNIILNINEALAIVDISPQELSWTQRQKILNILNLTKAQALKEFSQTDPIQACMIESDAKKIIEKIGGLDEEIFEQERVRKATIHDGDVALKELLNNLRRKTFTTKEALKLLLEINEETNDLKDLILPPEKEEKITVIG